MYSASSARENTLVALVLATIVGGAWMMGGYFPLARYWMWIGGWLAGGWAAFHLSRDWSLRRDNPALKPIWLLWAFFLVYLGISLFNPSYTPIELPRGTTFLSRDPIEWLPSVVAFKRSVFMILQLSGSMVLAWSVLALLRSRTAIRALLLGLVANAFVLSLAGAWFKVMEAEKILGIFPGTLESKYFSSFTYHNHWVAFASFHLILATGLLFYYQHVLRERGGAYNLLSFLGVCCFFLFLSLLLVESRTGLLVVGFYVVFVCFLLLRRHYSRLRKSPRLAMILVLGLIILGGITYQIALPQLSDTTARIEKAWEDLWNDKSTVDSFRFNAGPKITAELIERKPVLGWGWGSYPYAMSIYAPRYTDVMAQFAHNDWLQFVSELGLIGLFLFVFPLVHMTTFNKARDSLARFGRVAICVLLGIAFFEGPFTNPVVMASVLIVVCSDLATRQEIEVKRWQGRRRSF